MKKNIFQEKTNLDFFLHLFRLWVGGNLFIFHGFYQISRLIDLNRINHSHLTITYVLDTIVKTIVSVICALMIILGFKVRAASLIVALYLFYSIAFVYHFSGTDDGELAYVYMGAFAFLFFSEERKINWFRKHQNTGKNNNRLKAISFK